MKLITSLLFIIAVFGQNAFAENDCSTLGKDADAVVDDFFSSTYPDVDMALVKGRMFTDSEELAVHSFQYLSENPEAGSKVLNEIQMILRCDESGKLIVTAATRAAHSIDTIPVQ